MNNISIQNFKYKGSVRAVRGARSQHARTALEQLRGNLRKLERNRNISNNTRKIRGNSGEFETLRDTWRKRENSRQIEGTQENSRKQAHEHIRENSRKLARIRNVSNKYKIVFWGRDRTFQKGSKKIQINM